MKKPSKITFEPLYDYVQCRDYLQEKYGYNERDYLGKFDPKNIEKQDKIEYLDFWHWVIDNREVHNGCKIYFDKSDLKDQPKWIKTILGYYLEEFGEGKNKELWMWVQW